MPADLAISWDLVKDGVGVGLAAYENRSALVEIWRKLRNALLGRTYRIAVTGAEGAGKSVLVDHLTGEGFKPGYTPPGRSRHLETDKVQTRRMCFELLAIPGQPDLAQRQDALDEVFLKEEPLDGVIHMVNNGFLDPARIRHPEVAIAGGLHSIDDYRADARAAELNDLNEIVVLLRRHWVKHRKPLWMILAVAKVDLYPDELSAARERYELSSDSPYVDVVRELKSAIGALNIQIEVVPVCSLTVPFQWNGQVVRSEVNPLERDAKLGQFFHLVSSYCHAES